jgi:glycosyltransferase involved in cell wall biosynthesis
MRLLIASRAFAPSVGGLEAVAETLAFGLAGRGHQVRVVTMIEGEADPRLPYEVIRRPTARRLLALHRWAEVSLHMNMSLRWHWAALLGRARIVLVHHGVYEGQGWRGGVAAWIKRELCRGAVNVSVSQFVASRLPVRSLVIPNPYDDALFREEPGVPRDRDLVFLGRLVSDKGASLLLDALASLKKEGLRFSLSVVGDGPEGPALREQAALLGLGGQVAFLGVRRGAELARILNGHRVLVVPSLTKEGFGIVALEGIACGCVVIGSSGGGLPEAIGPCGLTFPNGDSRALAGRIKQVLNDPTLQERCRGAAPAHLARHTRERVVEQYVTIVDKAARKARP